MRRLISFGDSFVWGTELSDCKVDDYDQYSRRTWPALLAQSLDCEYLTLSEPACSNDYIARMIANFSSFLRPDDIVVTAWTFIERWEYYDDAARKPPKHIVKYTEDEHKWIRVLPTRANAAADLEQFTNLPTPEAFRFYVDYLHAETWNKYRTLQNIYQSQCLLDAIGCTSYMTCMSQVLWDKTFHSPLYVSNLRDKVLPRLNQFNGGNFLDFSIENKYPIGKYGHPLDQAHQAAFELIKPQLCQD